MGPKMKVPSKPLAFQMETLKVGESSIVPFTQRTPQSVSAPRATAATQNLFAYDTPVDELRRISRGQVETTSRSYVVPAEKAQATQFAMSGVKASDFAADKAADRAMDTIRSRAESRSVPSATPAIIGLTQMVPRVDTTARGQARSIETARVRATESARTTNIVRDSAMSKITDQPLTRTTSTPRPTPITTIIPPPPVIPSHPSSSGGSGGAGQRFRSFRETLRIGEGVRWIDINGRGRAPYRAPVARSEPAKGKTPTATKRKRGLRF
jgi:hypothetical protein